MQVNKLTADALRIDTSVVKPYPASAPAGAEPAAPVRRADEVEISAQGRGMVGDLPSDSSIIAELGADRVAHLRAKVAGGVYLTPEAADQTARGILRAGDL